MKEKTMYLNDENEEDTIEIVEYIDQDGNESVSFCIGFNDAEEYQTLSLHREAAISFIQKIISTLK